MNFFQFRRFCLLNVLLVTCLAYKFTEHKQASLDRIRRYVKRQTNGPCFYNMCNETDGYPFKEIENIVEDSDVFKKLFGTVIIPNAEISTKFVGENENLCDTVSTYLVPRRAMDTNGNWQTVVNVEKYAQIVYAEACVTGAVCYAQTFLASPYKTTCATQTVAVRMVIITADSKLKLGHFVMPVGCYCKYQFDLQQLI